MDSEPYSRQIGLMYTFREAGKCMDNNNDDLTSKHCSWGAEKRLRTIKLGCLIDRGLEKACKAGLNPKFQKDLFKEATEIVSKGLGIQPVQKTLLNTVFLITKKAFFFQKIAKFFLGFSKSMQWLQAIKMTMCAQRLLP